MAPRRRAAMFALTFVLLAGLILAGGQILSARHNLLAGAADLRTEEALLAAHQRSLDPGERVQLRGSLAAAHNEFGAARANLRLWSPLLDRLGWAPIVGPQLAAASPAADAADLATLSALHLIDGLAPAWPLLTAHRGRGIVLAQLAPALARGSRQFQLAQLDADGAANALAQVSPHSGNVTLDAASAHLRDQLPVLRTAARWLGDAPAILGAPHDSHYLIVLEDPTELRATGGFVGAAGYVTTHRGVLTASFSGSALPHEISSVPAPLPEALYTPEAYLLFRDANWSPDFPLSARTLRWFYGEDTGRWANGVIGIEDTAVPDLLAAAGPVFVPQYGLWVDARNAAALAQRYVNTPDHGPISGQSDTARKQFFGWVVQALLPRIQRLTSARWLRLDEALSNAVGRRDIMLYDRRAPIERAIRRSGAGGALRPVAGDSLAVIDDNRSYNKLNPYIHESLAYHVSIEPDLWLDCAVRLSYHVAPSPSSLEGYGPGAGALGGKHDYADFLRLYVPRSARLRSMAGVEEWAPQPAYGLTQFAGLVSVPEGETQTVLIRYRLPPSTLAGRAGRYTLTVRRQPGTNIGLVHVVLRGVGGVSLGGSQVLRGTFAFIHDLRLRTALRGSSPSPPLNLGSSPSTLDPYLPFASFHDQRHPL